MDRQKVIVRTSIIGIIANVFLAGFKAAVGLFSHSISVVLDAVNNLSDALSSVITIIGAKLSGKPADKKHPLGYGRVEYFSALIIGAIVLYAGITSLVESIKKIISPETPDYSVISLVIIAVAVLVKIFLGLYVMKTGKKVNSDSLSASGKDALMDSVISASVLVAAIIYLIWKVSLEAYLGVIISFFIIKAGFEVLRDTVSQILGERVDPDLAHQIKDELCANPLVEGAYDLILHAYGPETYTGSVHIEVPNTLTALELDALERELAATVYAKYNVALTGISVYSINRSDPEIMKLYDSVRDYVLSVDNVLQLHGFRYDKGSRTATMDLVISFDEKDRQKLCRMITEKLKEQHPEMEFIVTIDSDYSD